MRLTEAVYSRLTTEPASAALLGTRIYPLILPQRCQFPAVAYTRMPQDEQWSADGPTGYTTVRVQLDCYAVTYDGVRALADTVRAALNGWRDLALGVQCCRLAPNSEQDLREDEAPVPGAPMPRVTVDFLVYGEENP